ncbi:MAG: hypothetical protein AAB654_00860 [Acidobacteriota bacterium]
MPEFLRGREAVKLIVETLKSLAVRVGVLEKRAANTDELLTAMQTEIHLLKSAVDSHERFVEAVRALPGPKIPGGTLN